MSRTPNDLYPTTPEAAAAMRIALDRFCPVALNRAALDVSAGFGTLLEWCDVPRMHRWAIELSTAPLQLAELARRVPEGQIRSGVDALSVPWLPGSLILANPPFSYLQAFIERIIAEVAAGSFAAVLTPVAFWHAQRRAHLRPPNVMVALGWRPNFSCGLRVGEDDTASGPSQDFVIALYAPGPFEGTRSSSGTQWVRFERPEVPAAWVAEHERLARLAVGLPVRGLAPLFDALEQEA